MKLVTIGPSHPYRGGIATFTARLDQALSAHHEVAHLNFTRLYPSLLFPGRSQLVPDSAQSGGRAWEGERILDSVGPASWTRAARRVSAESADAVLFQWWHAFFGPAYGSIARRAPTACPKIAICHNVLPHDGGRLWRGLARHALSQMDGFVVHARESARALVDLLGPVPVLELFHPAYDVYPGEDMARADARRRLGLDQRERVVLFFGLVRPYKGVDVLLDAIAELDDIPDLRCFVVGEVYGGRARLEARIARGLADRVVLVDRFVSDEDVAPWFRASDVVALPYLAASQSGVVGIARRCRRPVIASRVGGLPEEVVEGRYGQLVEPGSVSELAHAIRRHFSPAAAVSEVCPDARAGGPRAAPVRAGAPKDRSWDAYAAGLSEFAGNLALRLRS